LAGGYYLIKRTGCGFWPAEREEVEDVEIQEVFTDNRKGLVERTKTIKTHKQETPLAQEEVISRDLDGQENAKDLSHDKNTDDEATPGPKKKP